VGGWLSVKREKDWAKHNEAANSLYHRSKFLVSHFIGISKAVFIYEFTKNTVAIL